MTMDKDNVQGAVQEDARSCEQHERKQQAGGGSQV